MSASCFRLLELQLKELNVILERRLPFEVTKSVLNLYEKNVQAAVAMGEIVSMWSCKQQSIELVKSMKSFCEGEEITTLSPAQCDFVWQLLKSFDHICMNSCQDLVTKLKELIVLYDPEDCYGFNRLPKWRQAMISDGFPARVINDWCVTFLMTPLEDLTSRDVDAIVDLSSRSLQLVASASQVIARIIFPKEGFEVKKGEGIKQGKMKERIRLARLLGEFINILRRRKPDENSKDAVVRDIVLDACNELCRSHEDSSTKRNDLYKIHGLKLKSLFTEIFGKRRRGEDGKEIIQDSALTPPTCDEDPKVVKCIARQTSYLHENLPFVLSQKDVYEPMIVLLRRWLSAIVMKPVLASHTLDIVKTLFSEPPSDANSSFLDGLHRKIQARILSLEENQSLMAQFQAAGYNQEGADKLDLWSSPAVELPCYLTKRESPNKKLHTKKLTEVLQRLWNEWKDILFMCDVSFINVGGEEVCTKDLFGFKDSLKEMEEQVAAVKEKVKHVHLEHFRSEDLDRRAERLIRLEQQYRKRIGKRYKTSINRTPEASEERKKFVAVWENRFLEQVKLCSEKIPGCYAPNGFHSEKPVICALSVDNRILTVFKEENGRRDELENVEVKLFEAGMYVYGLYTNGHDYVTDELWAAFYKMLLEKRLVPRIVLSNESPGFDWIKMKKYVEPSTSHPYPWKWELHTGIVPQGEDYFEYLPVGAALWPSLQGLQGLREYLTLTIENVSGFHFSDLKDVDVVEAEAKRAKELAGKAIKQLKCELQVLHGDNEPIRKVLEGKLTFAVKETVKSIVDGAQPTVETVKEWINMDRLAYGYPELERTTERRHQYATAVLSACQRAVNIQQ